MLTFFLFIIILWPAFNVVSVTVAETFGYVYDDLPQTKLLRRAYLFWYIPLTLIYMAITVRSAVDFDVFMEELEEAWYDPTYTPFQADFDDESYL